jgi:hypothetical protein
VGHGKLSDDLDIVLISRRRLTIGGPWHFNKGLNEYGNVSNCVESEMIMIKHMQDDAHIKIIDYYSFTQMRGSTPLFWSNDSSTGKPRLDRTIESTSEVFINHIKSLEKDYKSPIISLNLLGSTD